MRAQAAILRDFILRRAHPAAGPYRLWIDITSRCNLACPACAQRLLPPDQRRDMDNGLLASLAEQAGALGAQVSLFHRGEPLLRPDLGLWIRRFRAAGSPVRLHSNATLLDDSRAAELVAAGTDLVTLSIDSLDPDAYSVARPGAELAAALAGARSLLRARALAGRRRPRVTLLLMGRRARGAAADRSLAGLRALGLNRVVWRAPHNWAGQVGAVPAGGRRPAVCTFPWYALAVLSDGRVAPCPQDFAGRLALGRADRHSLAAIWQGRALVNLRRAFAAGRGGLLPVCCSCDRIRRPTLLGLPTEHLKNFIAESIVRTPRGG